MKKLNLSRKTLLGVALLGSFVAAPLFTSVAQADPPSHAPAYGRRAKDKKENRKERREDRREDRQERREDRRDDRDDRNNANYNGIVTNVRSGRSFDLRVNGRTYNVYTSSDLPRGLSRGDEVRVSGRPYGDNDIRNASVRVTDNNRNDPRRDDRNDGDRYQTFNGVVTNVRNSREFDVRVGGTTYNVYANNSASRLSNGDTVRIYGQRSGDNDIRNASVSVTRNR